MYQDKPIVLYDYQPTRNTSHPRKFLKDFRGVCVTDGYQVYHTLEEERDDLTVAGCWAHVRRRFDEAVKALPKAKRNESLAYLALKQIQAIYREEKKLADESAEKRLQHRQLIIKPMVDAYFAWVKENVHKVPAKGKTHNGFSYSINQEKYLRVLLEDGEVPIDNNAAEQSIRGFCIGKKNWVMIDTIAGAESSASYNQNIEPGQTINFGFIAELISGDDAIIENESLYQLTVIPDNEDEAVLEEDCIWEGDEVIDEMSLVTDEELDDDYDQMEEDDYDQELTSASVQLYAKSQSVSNEEDAGIQLYTASDDGKTESDKVSYYIYGLPHKKQVQAWCKSGKVIFVAQNDEDGNSVISYCEKVSSGKYEYKSEMQVSAAGHTQSLYCYKKKSNKYFLLINSHAVNFGEDIEWGTRFSRVIYDTKANGKNKDGKDVKNIMVDTKCDTTKMNLLRTYKEKKLKYFKAVAFARREDTPFAGWSKRKGVAKLKRCDFAISPNKEDMVIWKKSGKSKIEYSVFKWKKVLAMFKEAKGNVTFNSDDMRKLCEYDTFENVDRVAKRSFQGIAIDNSSNIIITSGNNRLHEQEPNKDKYITIFYKKAKKSVVGYKNSKEVMLVKPKYNSSTWMKELISKQVGISAQGVP